MKPSISACLIVKNEEKHLEDCLKSIEPVVDEIIIVDTGSSDQTRSIAGRYTAKIFLVPWQENFSLARNFALQQASGDWIFVIDADERLAQESRDRLVALINNPDIEGYLIKIINFFNSGNEILKSEDLVFRLFRNHPQYRYSGKIHEQITNNIKKVNPAAQFAIAEDVVLYHYGYLNEEINNKHKYQRNLQLLLAEVENEPQNLLVNFHLGIEYFRLQKYENALERFILVKTDINSDALIAPKLYRYLASCLLQLKKYQELLDFIEQEWRPRFPEQGDLHFLHGLVCQELNQPALAVASFKQCLHLPPQPAYYANVYSCQLDKVNYQLGQLAEYYQDLDGALSYYLAALRKNPDFVPALARIVAILEPAKYPQDALNNLEKVFDFSTPAARLLLAKLFFQEQAYGLALNCLETVLAEQTAVPEEYLFLYGICHLKTGAILQARAWFQRLSAGSSHALSASYHLILWYWVHHYRRQALQLLHSLQALLSPTGCLLHLLLKGYLPAGCTASQDENWQQAAWDLLLQIAEYQQLKKFTQARKRLQPWLPAEPGAKWVELYLKQNWYHLAEQAARQLVASQPEPYHFYLLGKSCWLQGKLLAAEELLVRAFRDGYREPRVARELANLYEELARQALEQEEV